LADGSDAEHQEQVLSMVETFVTDGTTVSVVAIGAGSDVPFLTGVAAAGDGRFYLTQRAADLPAIFAEEAARAKRSYIVEETFYPDPVTTWSPVAAIAATPPLRGYVATAAKDAAQVVWVATEGDPLLAVWQYGLGRSVAWTSDATGRWASEWVRWDAFARFWGDVVRHVLPSPTDTGLALRVLPEDDTARVIVDVSAPDASYVDGLDLQLQLVASDAGDGEAQTIALAQRAPGRYEGHFTPSGRDALLLRLFGDRNLVAGWAAPAPLEYVPGDAATSVERLASQGGGTVTEDPARVFVHDLRGREAGQPLAPVLILLVALLWPVDIAWRRLALTRADVVRLVSRARAWWGRRRARQVDLVSAAPPTLAATLRQRKQRPTRSKPVNPPLQVDQTGSESERGRVPKPRVQSSRPEVIADRDGSSVSSESQEEDTLATRLKRRLRD
jgi:hypothetical protein